MIAEFPNIAVHVVGNRLPANVEKAIKAVVKDIDPLEIPKRVATEKALRDYYEATLEAIKNSEGINLYPLLIPGMWAAQMRIPMKEARAILDDCGFDYTSYHSNKEAKRVIEATKALEAIDDLPHDHLANFFEVVFSESADGFMAWILEQITDPSIVIMLPMLILRNFSQGFEDAYRKWRDETATT